MPHLWPFLPRSAWAPATPYFSGSRSPWPPWKGTSSATRLMPSTIWRSCGKLGGQWARLALSGALELFLAGFRGSQDPGTHWVFLTAELGGEEPRTWSVPQIQIRIPSSTPISCVAGGRPQSVSEPQSRLMKCVVRTRVAHGRRSVNSRKHALPLMVVMEEVYSAP